MSAPAAETKRGRGRPALAANERASVRLPVYMTADERRVLDEWAHREGRPLAGLVLDRALRAARRG